jgi:hypothetical protein
MKCDEVGLYYYCEGDLTAQLWASGQHRWDISQVKATIEKYQPLPDDPDPDGVQWKYHARQRFLQDQKRLLATIFLQLKEDSKQQAVLFRNSPRYQKQLQIEQRAKDMTKIVMLVSDATPLCRLIVEYAEDADIRYLFPISEKLHEEDLIAKYGKKWKDVGELLFKTSKFRKLCQRITKLWVEDVFWDIPRRFGAYCLEPPSLKMDNHLPRISDWSGGFWSGEEKTAQRTILWCNHCILSNVQELRNPMLNSPRNRKSVKDWSCINDTKLFHYHNEDVFHKLVNVWLRND